jgi:hypothetical protein
VCLCVYARREDEKVIMDEEDGVKNPIVFDV